MYFNSILDQIVTLIVFWIKKYKRLFLLQHVFAMARQTNVIMRRVNATAEQEGSREITVICKLLILSLNDKNDVEKVLVCWLKIKYSIVLRRVTLYFLLKKTWYVGHFQPFLISCDFFTFRCDEENSYYGSPKNGGTCYCKWKCKPYCG